MTDADGEPGSVSGPGAGGVAGAAARYAGPAAAPGPTAGRAGLAAGDPIVIAAEHVVTPDGVLTPGWIRIADGRIEAVGPGLPPTPADQRAHWALPGFIDMHVHGGGGAAFTEGGPDDARRAAAFHRAHGTTRILASLVTGPADRLMERVAMLAGLADEGVIDGIHLEGPFLSAVRCGAQDPRYLIAPDVATFARLNAASRGWLRMITIAPELPGATAVIRAAAAAGVIAAAGHTDASAEVTSAAVDAGVSHATHLFNAMRPLGHRAPGPIGALLDRQVSCEVIADGTHLDDVVVRLAARAAGPGNLVLITDAMAAAGMPDGDYRLGALDVTVADGVARLAGPAPGGAGAIAGSTATMDLVVRRAITAVGLSVTAAADAASGAPARRLGLDGVTGSLRAGLAADVALLDAGFRLTAVIARGEYQQVAVQGRRGAT
jgi:N-acetylglucosamine-6-phosphate deacetylase